MKKIMISEKAGAFAENKDIAEEIRLREVMPALAENEEVMFDFSGVTLAMQSFIHTLISGALRKYGTEALDRMTFKSCNEKIKKIIGIVVDDMQEAIEIEADSE